MQKHPSCLKLLCLCAAALLAAGPAGAASWSGSITCKMTYSGNINQRFYSLRETQRWVLGKRLSQTGSRGVYAVRWTDTGQLVVPAGTWTVGPASADLQIDVVQTGTGPGFIDRNVVSGYSPPGVHWSGNVAKPNPPTFPAVEFDFLSIRFPANPGQQTGRLQQGTTPPSYYQLAKTVPGKSVCSWDLVSR